MGRAGPGRGGRATAKEQKKKRVRGTRPYLKASERAPRRSLLFARALSSPHHYGTRRSNPRLGQRADVRPASGACLCACEGRASARVATKRTRSRSNAPPSPLFFLVSPHSQLVLINISDHHTRLLANRPASEAGSPPPTCLGILLGTQAGRAVDVSNSFEAPHTREAGAGPPLLNEAVLAKKLDQCEWDGLGRR